MAAVLLREGQAVDAESAYREVLKDDPNNPDLYDGLGSSLLMQGRVKEAARASSTTPSRCRRRRRPSASTGASRTSSSAATRTPKRTSRSPTPRPTPRTGSRPRSTAGRLLQIAGRLRRGRGAVHDRPDARRRLLLGAPGPRAWRARPSSDYAAAAEDYLEAVRLKPAQRRRQPAPGPDAARAEEELRGLPLPRAGRRDRSDRRRRAAKARLVLESHAAALRRRRLPRKRADAASVRPVSRHRHGGRLGIFSPSHGRGPQAGRRSPRGGLPPAGPPSSRRSAGVSS